jgi:peptide/nickel transport system ATP-binding protein
MFEISARGSIDMSSTAEILKVRGLCKTFTQGRWWQKKFYCRALWEVNLSLQVGRTLAVIGDSGCGKTTLAMCLVGLEQPDAGEMWVGGIRLEGFATRQKAKEQNSIQLIFQDSAAALNPRMTAVEIVEEPLLINLRCGGAQRRKLAEQMIERVEIANSSKNRRPHEFSGGQRQRLAIARALVLKPQILIMDEIFVGLDLSVRGQIANLLLDLQQSHALAYLCISHNLSLVGQMAHHVVLMDRGRVVGNGTPAEVLDVCSVSDRDISEASSKAFVATAGSGAQQ